MATTRGGSAVIAHGPTDLRRYLPISLVATAVVAGFPLWVLLGPGHDHGFLATLLSVALSFALADLGARAWKRWPGSRDVVFNDLMLWGYVRRIIAQHRLVKRVERLGSSTAVDHDGLSREERTRLIKKLAIALENGDPFTHGHSQRVARHAYSVAKTMKLPREQAEKIRLAGVIHDVGKLRIPREIITKPGKLTEAQFDVIKSHTVDGARMVAELRDPELTDMVRHHHERLDGSGYPDNLPAEDISIGARVLAVADTFDAASSVRPYRAAEKHQVALDILKEEAASGRLDPVVVDAFIDYYSGGRALRWWAFLLGGPVNLYNVSISLGGRLGAAGLANAAVVGVTAVALAPWHGFDVPKPDRPGDRRVATSENGAEEEKSQPELRGSWGPTSNAAGGGDSADEQSRAGRSTGGRELRGKVKGNANAKGRPDREKGEPPASPGKSDEAKDNGSNGGSNSGSNGNGTSAQDPNESSGAPAAVAGAVEDSTEGGAAALEPVKNGSPGLVKGDGEPADPIKGSSGADK